MIELLVRYPDGRPDFRVGVVQNEAEADAWEAQAKTEPGWVKDSVVIRIIIARK